MTIGESAQLRVLFSSGIDDCIGAIFDGEQEAVVFIPTSGDILLCAADAWRNLSSSLSRGTASSDQDISPESQPLLATLRHLGVSVDELFT